MDSGDIIDLMSFRISFLAAWHSRGSGGLRIPGWPTRPPPRPRPPTHKHIFETVVFYIVGEWMGSGDIINLISFRISSRNKQKDTSLNTYSTEHWLILWVSGWVREI